MYKKLINDIYFIQCFNVIGVCVFCQSKKFHNSKSKNNLFIFKPRCLLILQICQYPTLTVTSYKQFYPVHFLYVTASVLCLIRQLLHICNNKTILLEQNRLRFRKVRYDGDESIGVPLHSYI